MSTKTKEKTEDERKLPEHKWRGPGIEHYARSSFLVTAAPGATVEDLKRPMYWRTAAPYLSRHDVVHVLAVDESWEAECRVERSHPQSGTVVTVVRVIDRVGVNGARQEVDDAHYLQFVGGKGFCVFRKHDDYAIIIGHATEQAARHQFLTEHTRIVPGIGA